MQTQKTSTTVNAPAENLKNATAFLRDLQRLMTEKLQAGCGIMELPLREIAWHYMPEMKIVGCLHYDQVQEIFDYIESEKIWADTMISESSVTWRVIRMVNMLSSLAMDAYDKAIVATTKHLHEDIRELIEKHHTVVFPSKYWGLAQIKVFRTISQKLKEKNPRFGIDCFDRCIHEMETRIYESEKENYKFTVNMDILRWTDEIYKKLAAEIKEQGREKEIQDLNFSLELTLDPNFKRN